MTDVSNGHIDILIDKNRITKDEIGVLTACTCNLVEIIGKMINDLSLLTHEITANGNSEYRIDAGQYKGSYNEMIAGINHLTDDYMKTVANVSFASDQVAAGARQISENSSKLAGGANEQALSVEELTAIIRSINENTRQNADNAREAEHLSISSRDNAERSDKNMSQLLAAMEKIKESSQSMLSVIKVIDDIAFQTNILALNAAVEAARAGTHGKGFSVVAEEVRNLAGKSQLAAKETAELIEESIHRVGAGTQMTDQTAAALEAIVGDITKISDYITEISKSCEEQAAASNQITVGVNQITDVAQYNSAAAEEAASVSEELSAQANILRDMVAGFKFSDAYMYISE